MATLIARLAGDTVCDAFQANMFFEDRKSLIGFRLKLILVSESRERNVYTFVDVSKTPTVDSFLKEIAFRFNLKNDLRITCHECEILASESILVLANIDEIKIHSTFLTYASSVNHENRNDSATSVIENFNSAKLLTKSKPTRKSYANRGIASFLEQLQKENNTISNHCDIMEKSTTKPDETFYSEIVRKECSNFENTDDLTKDYQSIDDVDESLADTSDLIWGKKKRKRTRKHSKKTKEYVKKDLDDVDAPLEKICVQSASRKHIYFNDDDMDVVDNVENNDCELETEVLKYVDETIPQSTTGSSFYRVSSKTSNGNQTPVDNSTPTKTIQKSNSKNSILDLSSSIKPIPKNTDTDRQLGTLLMYKELKTCGRYNVQFLNRSKTDTAGENGSLNNTHSESEAKDSSVGHEITQTNTSTITNNSVCTAVSYSMKTNPSPTEIQEKEVVDEVLSNGLSSEKVQNDKTDDCEMILQFKIIDDNIYLRNSNNSWQLLTVARATMDLHPVTTPAEGQSIIFQLLYLKHNVWPTLSDLIFGRVLKCTGEKVAVEIPPAFLKKLLRNSAVEEPTLPEGMTCISGAVYELDWFTLKNPRLLS